MLVSRLRPIWSILRPAFLVVSVVVLARVCSDAAEPDASHSAKNASLQEYDDLIGPDQRDHWSYKPVKRPPIPLVKQPDWALNPIDRFVLEHLEKEGWNPSPPADRRALLRRIYLDLTGMPPTPQEQERFLADDTPGAWERTVDDLLARPGYGERWGRHWLDLVRYAESNGYERDAAKPYAWRYRDYVIAAFNRDLPYNRFVIEQLAGDEVSDATSDSVLATTYLRLGPWDDEPADPAADRFDQLDDIVDTTAQVYLGLTMGCCRCHNHKFEALTAADYYRMVAVFNPLKRPQKGRTELTLPAGPRDAVARQKERDRQIEPFAKELNAKLDPVRKEWLSSGKSKLPKDAQNALRTEPEKRNEVEAPLAAKYAAALDHEVEAIIPAELRPAVAELRGKIERIRSETPDLPEGYLMHEASETIPATHVLLRGNPGRPGPEVMPAYPLVLTDRLVTFATEKGLSTRRRLALAQQIASDDNPLTARIIVNRIWQFHFGDGIVRTPSDFGVMGEPPTHPELLDWLADWFVHEAGWSMKRLHRLILTSNTYRMSKQTNAEYAEVDPENHRLWRFPYKRLQVEAIRDSVLAVSGQINLTMYGPSMYPEVPRQALEGHSDPDKIWPTLNEKEASRRTVYAFIKRSLVVPMLEVLDLCDTTRSSSRRQITTVAPQALTLFNGEFVNRQAKHFAERLLHEAGPDRSQQISLAYRLALCRPPKPTELAAALAYLESEAHRRANETKGQDKDAHATERRSSAGSGDPRTTERAKELKDQNASNDDSARYALEQFCRVVLNLNEFVYPD